MQTYQGDLTNCNLQPSKIQVEHCLEIVRLIVSEGLGPILYWKFQKIGVVPDTHHPALVEASRQAGLHFMLLDKEQQSIHAALTEAGIPAIWLKGIALAKTVYPQPWLRPMSDLDVLVPLERRGEAVEIVGQLGYRRPNPAGNTLAVLGAPECLRHHDTLTGGPAGLVTLEIHFRLLGPAGNILLPDAQLTWFWSHAQELVGPNGSFTILKPEAHLLYLCAHALLQHGEAQLDLLHLLDLHLLVMKSELDWDLLEGKALELGWAHATARALHLARDYFNTPLPVGVLDRLAQSGRGEENARTAVRLRNRIGRWEEWRTIFQQMSPAKRALMVWITLFPPQDYLRSLYDLKPGAPVLPYYPYRWWDGGREVARSVWASWKKYQFTEERE